MKPELRIVTQTPLNEIWNEQGIVSRNKIRDLNSSDITDLLRINKVCFVIADIGSPLQWIMPEKCYAFWKSVAKPHIADPELQFSLQSWLDEYCYFASEWKSDQDESIILLVKAH